MRQDGDGVSRVRSAASGERLASLRSTNGPAIHNEFSPDERLLGTRYANGALIIRDWATGRIVFAQSQPVRAYAFTPDSQEVLIQGEDRQLSLITLASSRLRWRRRMDTHVWELVHSPNAQWLAVDAAGTPTANH